MNHKLLTIMVTLATVGTIARAQTADTFVTQGRAFLAARNLAAANTNFAAALATNPNHQTGNVFYAATRLLTLQDHPASAAFLTRLGLPVIGRNPYRWTSHFTNDTNHIPLAPIGMNAGEFTPNWRTNMLPEIQGALLNLARVTDTTLLINVASNETTHGAVTMDYGDVLMLRALLHGLEYFTHTIAAQNLDVQLTVLRSFYTNSHLSLEGLLAAHPQLLTYADTNDLTSARAAFVNAADRYMDASDFMRARPAGLTRMFNLIKSSGKREQDFRQTLIELKASLTNAVPLSLHSGYTLFMGAQFSGTAPIRSSLPEFRGHRMVLGSLDPTFGGVLVGHTRDEVEDYLFGSRHGPGKHIATVPSIPTVRHSGGAPFGFTLRAQPGRGYVVQASTNLLNWVDVAAFIAVDGAVDFLEQGGGQFLRRFYRIVDRNQSMPLPTNDSFANATVLTGSPVQALGFNRGASSEPGENISFGDAGKSVWYAWIAPANGFFVVQPKGQNGFYPDVSIYTGSTVGALTQVGNGYSPFSATAGQTYYIKVDGSLYSSQSQGGFKLTITQPPAVAFITPASGATFTAGASIPIQVSATDPDGTIAYVDIFANNRLARLTNSPYTFLWTNVPPGNFYLNATAGDNLGVSGNAQIPITIFPANDSFANRITLSGAAVFTTGANAAATTEAGEPNHAGASGSGNSVWWTWTAPSNGTYTIVAELNSPYGSPIQPILAVYTGAAVASLTSVGSQLSPVRGPAVVTLNGVSGQAYQIAVASQYGNAGNIKLRIVPSPPPQVAIVTPNNNSTLYANGGVTNVTIFVSASAQTGGTVSRVDLYYANGGLIASRTNAPFDFTRSLYSPSTYDFQAVATDNQGAVGVSSAVHLSLVPPPPPNDLFANALVISGGSYSTNGLSNVAATKDPGEPNHAGYFGGVSIWWSWTAPKSGSVTISTSTSYYYYPLLAVYTGAAVNSLNSVTSNYGFGSASISFNATAGTTYRIAVDDLYGNGGTVSLNLNQP